MKFRLPAAPFHGGRQFVRQIKSQTRTADYEQDYEHGQKPSDLDVER
jgi:hypothetical protein